MHRQAQAREVLGDVAGDAAGGFMLGRGIGAAHAQRTKATELAVEVGAPNADDGLALREHIGAPEDAALLRQLREMAGDGRARQAELVGQFLLADEGVGFDQSEQLVFG